MSKAKRPRVICHMVPSLDGRIVTSRWKLPPRVLAEYERTARTFRADAWMIGRISMGPYAGATWAPRRKRSHAIPRVDFIARRDAESYAIALDPAGKLDWKSASIDEEHVVTVLTERVGDDYLTALRSRGVSYLFGGKDQIRLDRVLAKLREELGIETLLLEGGGKINGSFLEADLIDEISVLVAPIADGTIAAPSLFDAPAGNGPARPLRLLSAEKRTGDLVWLRYEVKR